MIFCRFLDTIDADPSGASPAWTSVRFGSSVLRFLLTVWFYIYCGILESYLTFIYLFANLPIKSKRDSDKNWWDSDRYRARARYYESITLVVTLVTFYLFASYDIPGIMVDVLYFIKKPGKITNICT